MPNVISRLATRQGNDTAPKHQRTGYRLWLTTAAAGALVSVLLSIVAVKRVTRPADMGGAEWRAAQELAVMKAVFQRQIGLNSGLGTYYLEVGDVPREPDFVRQLRPHLHVIFEKRSFRPSANSRGFVDPDTGHSAAVLWIESVSWVSDDHALIRAVGATASLSGSSGVYSVSWLEGHWEVEDFQAQHEF